MEKIFKGELLKDRRIKAGLSQLELANKVNEKYGAHIVDSRSISRWERNPDATPFHNKISKVAEVLDISLNDLYGFPDTEEFKLISYNVNGFYGPTAYDNRHEIDPEQRMEYLTKIGEYLKPFLEESLNNIVLLQEVPSDLYHHFKMEFRDYKLIEPVFKNIKPANFYSVAIINNDSCWVTIEEEMSIFSNNKDYFNRIVELQYGGHLFLGVHMRLDNKALPLWNRLLDKIKEQKYAGIIGDFNAHFNSHSESSRRKELQTVIDNGFVNLVSESFVTYYEKKTTIDHVLIAKSYYTKDSVTCEVLPINLSDHALIIAEVHIPLETPSL